LPRRSLASNLSLGWLPSPRTSGDSPGPRQPPFGAGHEALSTGLWVPLAFRRVAFASWAFLFPLRDWAVLPKIVRLTGPGARPHRGYHVPHQSRRGGGGCLLYCAARVPGHAGGGTPLPDRGRSLVPGRFIVASAIGCDDLSLRSLDGGSFAFTRPAFPSPGSPGWFRLPLGFTRLLSHAALPGRLRGSGTDMGTCRGSGDSPLTTRLERLRVARPLRNHGALPSANPCSNSASRHKQRLRAPP
jgi:hypothetical protein